MQEINASRLIQARTCILKGDDESLCVISIKSTDGENHYWVSRNEFSELAKQFSQDAVLIGLDCEHQN